MIKMMVELFDHLAGKAICRALNQRGVPAARSCRQAHDLDGAGNILRSSRRIQNLRAIFLA